MRCGIEQTQAGSSGQCVRAALASLQSGEEDGKLCVILAGEEIGISANGTLYIEIEKRHTLLLSETAL